MPIPSNASAGSFRLLFCHPRTGEPLLCHNDNVKLTVTLAPAKLTISPTSHDYGDVATNNGKGKRFTVRNVGRRWSGAVSVSRVGDASFDFIGYSCGPSLAPNATCTIDAVFAPTAAGTFHASVKVKPSANYSTGAIASLTGTGVAPAGLSADPMALDFGTNPVGSSEVKTVTVTNPGGVPTGDLLIFFVGAGYDLDASTTCTSEPLAPGASCVIGVKFAPTYPGQRDTYLSVSSDSPLHVSISITGNAVPPPI